MTKVKVPPELIEALSAERGFSLLIRGAPGTGKTMLALEMIHLFGDANAIYLSTRVSPSSLHEQFPWLGESIPPVNVIDTTKLYVSADIIPGIQSFPDTIYSRLGKIKKPATVVIDSWEAITAQIEREREKIDALAAAVTELARHEEINLILVSEKFGISPITLDYMVDGVVTLSSLTMDHRNARELELEKLRGVRINQPRYPFTLEGGRFQCIEPFKRKSVGKKLRVAPVQNTETHISTGNEEMDTILGGGFERGSFNVIEMGDDMSIWGYQLIAIHMLINSIAQKNHCICLPCCGWDERHLRQQLLPFVSEEDYMKYMTVFEIAPAKREYEVSENVRFLEGKSIELDWGVIRSFVSELEPPVLTSIGTDMLEHPYQLKEKGKLGTMVKWLSCVMTDTRAAGNVVVLGVNPKLELCGELTHLSTTYLKLAELDTTIVLYGVRPATGLHCLETIVADNRIKLGLTPYV
ncbi:MAG: gas vesicle protein GvpD P-loop domain-containing protein [Euryarchaeota archaeon]|nr:gas vesicle protein GvpD P-loop domain-containing protein [Euryarchaeota archaeon]